MPKYCSVIGCNNTYKTGGVSMHDFPKSPRVRKRWEDFVKVHRADFRVSGIRQCHKGTETLTSKPKLQNNEQATPVVCGMHFQREDYENLFAYERGFDKKRMLRKGAVPSVQPSREVLDELRSSARSSGATASSSKARLQDNIYDQPRPTKRKRIGDVSKKLDMARLLSTFNIPLKPPSRPETTTKVIKETKVKATQPSHKHESVQVNIPVPRKSKGTQVQTQKISIGVQCNLMKSDQRPPNPEIESRFEDLAEPDDTWRPLYRNDDPDFEITPNDWMQERLDAVEDTVFTPLNENLHRQHFIVSGECIEELLNICPVCAGPATTASHKRVGSMIEIERVCSQTSCGTKHIWRSQKMVRKMAVGNLLMSAGILFGGLQASRTLRLFDNMEIPRISESTFYRHQKLYLEPTIISSWMEQQEHLLARLRDLREELVVSGDGRCDSPGYCAKYGSYTLLETRINRVISTELVQSNEVPNSSWMENEGLKRCIQDLSERCPKIGTIITDRHKQNNKWIRENLTKHGTKHYFDIWHVAKGLSKKIHKLGCQRDCGDAGLWRKSLVNHLYWVAGSTSDGNSDVMKAKWLSCLNHMVNIHEGHGALFPECAHREVEGIKWLRPGSKVLESLAEIVENKNLIADIGRLSPKYQTSSLESFHALIIAFAPKSTAFSYIGMKCRVLLAALHYNENADRPHAMTAKNEPRLSIAFSRSNYGDPFLRQEKSEHTFRYVKDLTMKLLQWYTTSPEKFSEVVASINVPPTLASMKERPTKDELLKKRVNRFVQS